MNHRFIAVLVEGQTEERFVKNNLDPWLFENFNTNIQPVTYTTKVNPSGKHYKGGGLNFTKMTDQIERLLRSPQYHFVTTFIDYYALPDEFFGDMDISGKSDLQKANMAEQHMSNKLGSAKFIPYIQMFEFEALLFSCPDSLLRIYPERKESARNLISEASSYSTPEEINDGPETHPSARLEKCFPGYGKILDSQQILKTCSIGKIREKCPRFDRWIQKLTV
ncbi:MAG: DUF4276 family protein [Ignavibacteriaceae bacterium]|nr:DUF4276 family protein [Ignavibacteriaceae bacterium]